MDHRLLTDALLASAPRGLAAGRCFEASNQALAVPQFHVTGAPYLLCSFDCLSVVCTLYKRVALDMTFVVKDVHSIIGHAILSPDFTSGLRAERSRNHSYGLNGIQISGSPRQQVIYDPDCPSLSWLEGEGRDPGRKNGYGNELPNGYPLNLPTITLLALNSSPDRESIRPATARVVCTFELVIVTSPTIKMH